MSELRYNHISNEWVIIATERAKRPREFLNPKKERINPPELKADCPFCPGNENQAPQEAFRIGDQDAWKVRVVYNKFPALTLQHKQETENHGIYHSMDGFGVHEVIIDNPRHNAFIPLISEAEMSNIILTYQSRYRAIEKIGHIEDIIIFKNHGEQAGTSLEHPHSQLIATPIVPPQTQMRVDNVMNYFKENGECIFCKTLKEELKVRQRIVAETEFFVSFIPYAALSPFHLWVFPRRHSASFADIQAKEVSDLSRALKLTISKLYYALGDPDYNYTIHSIPIHETRTQCFHWYISIIPRITKVAGFELGSGMFINISLPEESAKFLREFEIKDSVK